MGLKIIALLLPVAFWPWWESGMISLRWAIIGCLSVLLVKDRSPLNYGHLLGFLFLGWAAMTLDWSKWNQIQALCQLGLLAGVFSVRSSPEVFAWAAAGMIPSSAASIVQAAGINLFPNETNR